MFFDTLDLFVLGAVIGKLKEIGWATTEMAAKLVSINFFGIFIGVIIAGFLVDRFGRRTLYMYNMVIYSVFTVLCGLAPNFETLIVLRFITAFGLGGEVAIGYSLICEYFPPRKRGRLGLVVALCINVAAPLAYFLGMLVLPTGEGAWRTLFIICGIPAFYAWYLRRQMPESPRWLENVGKYEKAEKILSEIEAAVERDTGKPLPPVEEIIVVDTEKTTSVHAWEILKKQYIRSTLISSFLFVACWTLIYSLTTWLPTYFVSQGINVKSSMWYSTIMVFGAPVGMMFAYFMVDFGRKKSIVVMSIIGCILAFFYSQASSIPAFVALGFCTMVCLYCITGISQATYIPELFPTILRGRGVSLTEAVGRLSTIISPIVVVWIMGKWGFITVIVCVCAILALMALVIGVFGKETANKKLEDVNERAQGLLAIDR